MMGAKRLLAGVGAALVIAASVVTGMAGSAAATPALSVTPAGPYTNLQKVTVTSSGWPAKAPVAIGVCPAGKPLTGPADCGLSKLGASVLTSANASGTATTTLTIIEGNLQASAYPGYSCNNVTKCAIASANISAGKNGFQPTYALTYKGGGGTGAVVVTKTPTTKAPTTDPKASKAKVLAHTGPRQTMILGLIGLAILQIGFIFAVRASRAAPRRIAS